MLNIFGFCLYILFALNLLRCCIKKIIFALSDMNSINFMTIQWGCDDWALLPLLRKVIHSWAKILIERARKTFKKLINNLQINPQSSIWINRTVFTAIRWFLTVGVWLALQRMKSMKKDRVQRFWGEERIILNNGYIFELLRNVLLPCDCRALWDCTVRVSLGSYH